MDRRPLGKFARLAVAALFGCAIVLSLSPARNVSSGMIASYASGMASGGTCDQDCGGGSQMPASVCQWLCAGGAWAVKTPDQTPHIAARSPGSAPRWVLVRARAIPPDPGPPRLLRLA